MRKDYLLGLALILILLPLWGLWLQTAGCRTEPTGPTYEQAKKDYKAALDRLESLQDEYKKAYDLHRKARAEWMEEKDTPYPPGDDAARLEREVDEQRYKIEESRAVMVGAWNRENPNAPRVSH